MERWNDAEDEQLHTDQSHTKQEGNEGSREATLKEANKVLLFERKLLQLSSTHFFDAECS